MKKTKKAHLIYVYTVFVMMTAGIIYFKPEPLLFIPLLVSVAIMFLQSKVNRYAFLVGAINAVLYAVAYIKMSLYATSLYAILISCPIQLVTFFNWSKHTEKQKTELKQMSGKTRVKAVLGMAGAFAVLYLVFSKLNSRYLIWDNSITILGTVSSILCLMRFKEYTFLQIFCNLISLITFLMMLGEDSSRIIWVINSLNAIISTSIAMKNMKINKRED